MKQELISLPEHLSSPLVFSGVRVTRVLVLCVCFVDRCLSFCTFSFGHCFVCSSSIYRFWLPLWYLQTLLKHYWLIVLLNWLLFWYYIHVYYNVNGCGSLNKFPAVFQTQLGPSWRYSYGSWIHRWCCEFESRSGRGVQQWLATGLWFSPGPPVSSTNKTDRHDIAEILLKVALNTITKNTIACLQIFVMCCVLLNWQNSPADWLKTTK